MWRRESENGINRWLWGLAGVVVLLLATAIGAALDSARHDVSRFDGSDQADRADLLKPGSEAVATKGDAARGEKIFFEKAEVYCHKCHAIHGRGGNIGPDLSRIGAEKTREYLLESLLDPNRVIAEGYSTQLVMTIDGDLVFGVVREDGPSQVRIVDVEAREHIIAVENIEERRPGLSAMPGDLDKSLRPDELQDLVEFLASLK